jgi:hypothetical protein
MMQQFDITRYVRGYPDYLNLETLNWYSPGGIVTCRKSDNKNSHAILL